MQVGSHLAPGSAWREALRGALQRRQSASLQPGGVQTRAAVLVPIVEVNGALCLWLLKRSSSMRKHAGQVAFPGGKQDETDADLVETALREADEELGLRGSEVDVLGTLDDLLTSTGFRVTPVVGVVAPSFVPVPNPDEVAAVFLAPLGRFLTRPSWATPFGYIIADHWVWGATAKIARQCAELTQDSLARI